MKHFIAMCLSLTVCVAEAGWARADTVFDTNSLTPATQANYWPWGDATNTRYQLWYSQASLGGVSGVLTSISQFAANATNLGAIYTLDIYASTTSLGLGTLSASHPDSNDGANKTLIFSGSQTFSSPTLTFDVDKTFTYDGSGNLLLDFVFHGYTGVGANYDGPLFESMESNPNFLRVTQNAALGDAVWDWGALRTQLEFDPQVSPVPEPASLTLAGSCMLCLFGYGWRRRRITAV